MLRDTSAGQAAAVLIGSPCFAEVTHELVDDIVVTRINHTAYHDLEGVNSATFLGQTKLGSGPDAGSHIATGIAVRSTFLVPFASSP
jgi:hypothetical protein